MMTVFLLYAVIAANMQIVSASERAPHAGSEAQEKDIDEFRDNYVPAEFHPDPEYLRYIDLGILFLLLVFGFILFIKTKSRSGFTVAAAVSLVYFGMIRGGCICPVGAMANISKGILQPELVGRMTALLFILPLATALIAGRIFCTAGCPLGALQHLFYKKKFIKLPKWLNIAAVIATLLIACATIVLIIQRDLRLVCLMDPYKPVFFTFYSWVKQVLAFINNTSVEYVFLLACSAWLWVYFFVMIFIGYWVPRPFCRFLCPYGVLLGLFSFAAFKPRYIKKESCVGCGACRDVCPVQAISKNDEGQSYEVSCYKCVQCNSCSAACNNNAV
jgi:polyferredoxin